MVLPFYHTIVYKGVPRRNTIACHCGRSLSKDTARELGAEQLKRFREMDRHADYFMQMFQVVESVGFEIDLEDKQ